MNRTSHAFIGIDPGLSGALALLSEDGELVELLDMPVSEKLHGKGNEVNPAFLADALDELLGIARDELDATPVAVLERVSAMPGQGVTSMFNFGASYGMLRGVLAARHVPVTYVTPQRWKKFFGLDGRKGGSITRATEEWPTETHRFRRAKDDGRAEAALIGLWGLRDGTRVTA